MVAQSKQRIMIYEHSLFSVVNEGNIKVIEQRFNHSFFTRYMA